MLTHARLRHYGASLSTAGKVAVLAILGVLALAAFAPTAQAQSIQFTIDAVYTAPTVIPRLQWTTTPAATSCTASGDPAWTGAKPASGSAVLPAVLPPRTYTLRCTYPDNTSAVIAWVAPTQNSDGSPLTDLARYRVRWGTAADNLTQERLVNAPLLTTTITGLAAGTWHFGVHSRNTLGVESPISNTVSKTTGAGLEVTQTVGVSVPAPPTNVTVQ